MNGTYMTVGEVAERLGITVRSIQYYDQQGILSPSAKGPQNQRLYTQHDVERLYEVVCLKFAGLSLAQIKERMAGEADGARTAAVFSDAMAETEKAFSALLRRYQMLRILSRGVAEAERDGAEPDWESMARVIGRKGEEGRYFWRLSCIYDEEASAVDGDEREPSSERDLVAAWHGIMAECVALMRAQEPLDSPAQQGGRPQGGRAARGGREACGGQGLPVPRERVDGEPSGQRRVRRFAPGDGGLPGPVGGRLPGRFRPRGRWCR